VLSTTGQPDPTTGQPDPSTGNPLLTFQLTNRSFFLTGTEMDLEQKEEIPLHFTIDYRICLSRELPLLRPEGGVDDR
jgi:hypothetical protein